MQAGHLDNNSVNRYRTCWIKQ